MAARLAYVTGGMGGIGTAICRRLCKEGYTVVAGCGPGSQRKDRWVGEMRAQGFEVHASEGNVADWESTRAAFEKVRNELGPVDVLVNNAGVTADGTFRKMTFERWRKEVLAARLMTVYGVWQADVATGGQVMHLIARRVVDHSELLGSLAARSRDFR